jgi:hypothetical protein
LAGEDRSGQPGSRCNWPGYQTLCRETGDPITWRRFCRIPLDVQVPHPTTWMKLTAMAVRRIAATGRRAAGCRRRRAVHDLAGLLAATQRIAAQTRQRLSDTTPDGATRRSAPVRFQNVAHAADQR